MMSRLPSFRTLAVLSLCVSLGFASLLGLAGRGSRAAAPGETTIKGWQKGKGWGWIWGKDDEVGALNGLTAESRAEALRVATRGEVFDLGMTYSRRSFKWPGHSPGEILTFRSPDGIRRMQDGDAPPPDKNRDQV